MADRVLPPISPAAMIRAVQETVGLRCWNCRRWPDQHAPDGGCSGMPTMYEPQSEILHSRGV